MTTPAKIEAFDTLLWVCNGQHAGQVTALSQPSISRAAHEVAQTLGVSLRKIRGEWHVNGDTLRLSQERQVQQAARWDGHAPIRLEAGAVSSHLVAHPAPLGWVLGRADAINLPRSLALLYDRVVDAWLCTSTLDLPPEALRTLAVFDLYRAPLRLVVSTNHPLAGERGLTPADLAAFPSVALLDDWYPNSAVRLREHGLWSTPRQLTHHRRHHWEGRTADGRTLAYASPLTLARQPDLAPLDYELGLDHAMALLVLREWMNHPRIQALVEELQKRLSWLQREDARLDEAPFKMAA
jgi:hypothetical protein